MAFRWRHMLIAVNLAGKSAKKVDMMQVFRSRDFTGARAWDAIDIASMNAVTTRLHWTDQAYIWHVNGGSEVFAVLDGRVEMFLRKMVLKPRLCWKRVMCSMHRSGHVTRPLP